MSRLRQSRFSDIKLRPWMLKLGFSIFPPLLGANIRLEYLSHDFQHARVAMRQRITNSNPWGVHFGGSLFAMTDSIYSLMVKQNLGAGYVVWDKSATIDFLKPGRGRVWCEFRIDAALITRIRHETEAGGKSEPVIEVHVFDHHKDIVASVRKTLYIRKRPTASTSIPTSTH